MPRHSRIADKFKQLRARNEAALIPFVIAGDPDLDSSARIVREFEAQGADLIELGVPFSDPMADGPANQRAHSRGLAAGASLRAILSLVSEIRRDSQIPIVLFGYFNPIFHYGCEQFCADAARAGVDGLLVLDLPPEEAGSYEDLMRRAGLCVIYLVAPTTPEDRIKTIVKRGSGFVYYVSREGVTGMQQNIAANIGDMTARIRKNTDLPIAVGFGISNPDQARLIAAQADAVVVGSAIVNQIARFGKSPDLIDRVSQFVEPLIRAVKP